MKRTIIIIIISLSTLVSCSSNIKETNIPISEDVKLESTSAQKETLEKEKSQTKLVFKYTANNEQEKLLQDLIVAQVNQNKTKLTSIYYPSEVTKSEIDMYMNPNEKAAVEKDILKMWNLREDQWRNQIMAKGPSGESYNENTLYYPYQERLKTVNYNEIKVIAVDTFKQLTKEADMVSQFPSGNYTFFYVLIKPDNTSSWQVFDEYFDFTQNITNFLKKHPK
ncbi:hypothetical protein [Clostridium manihotivorum]|uniref:Lipoprotein n=1 Tax=Clostridium manihotivorum TaxID=2320868 RepID=A0A3R5U860_9CLOT|nr:hypothetical protein [Clostridium manihotivorum]QAA34414.1 hypothetical protein C1I91_23775 [Clostridium manihotivorum]